MTGPGRLSDEGRTEAFLRESATAWFLCVTLDHPSFSEPVYVVDNNQDVIRTIAGQQVTFRHFPFEMELPGDDPEHPLKIKVVIYDPQGEITYKIRGVRPAPTMIVECLTSKNPNVVERGPYAMTLKTCDSENGRIEGEFGFEDILDDPFPGDTVNPANHPGLFQ